MMISPDYFREIELEGKSKEEIMTVIRRLKRWIAETKREAEKPSYTAKICPGPDVVVSCCRDYLSEAIRAYTEAGGEYTMTRSEKEDKAFQDDLACLKTLALTIGDGSKSEFDRFRVDLGGDIVEAELNGEALDPMKYCADKEEWFFCLGMLHIGEWKKHYANKEEAEGGETWELVLSYDNGKERIYKGENACPYNFHNLTEMLGRP